MESSDNSGSDEGEPVLILVITPLLKFWFHIPDEGTKHDRSSASTANATAASTTDISPERSNGDPASEPEQHSQRLNADDGELVGGGWEARWREDEICDGEESPYRAEEKEVDAVGRPAVPGASEGINDCERVSGG